MSVTTQISATDVRHDDLAAQRGVPSLIWRAGQQRRFEMILRWGLPAGALAACNKDAVMSIKSLHRK